MMKLTSNDRKRMMDICRDWYEKKNTIRGLS